MNQRPGISCRVDGSGRVESCVATAAALRRRDVLGLTLVCDVVTCFLGWASVGWWLVRWMGRVVPGCMDGWMDGWVGGLDVSVCMSFLEWVERRMDGIGIEI